MNLKAGDKLLCKKTLQNKFWMTKKDKILNDIVEEGKCYTILKVSHPLYVNIELDDEYFSYFSFSTSSFSSVAPLLLWDYFYTIKETRKIKLDNL